MRALGKMRQSLFVCFLLDEIFIELDDNNLT